MLAKVETMAVVGLTAQEVTAEVKGQRTAKRAIEVATTFRVDRFQFIQLVSLIRARCGKLKEKV